MSSFIEVGNALLAIKVDTQYVSAGFETFEDYCQTRWGFAKRLAYDTMGAARVGAPFVEPTLHDIPS